MYTYNMTETRQKKKAGTKTVFETYEETQKDLTQKHYDNMTCKGTLQWFRRLGGSETATRSYTRAGYIITHLTSTRPDKEERILRAFNIKEGKTT